MQIPSLPPPLLTNPLPQDVAGKVVHHAQATPPLIHRPVDPSPKSEKFSDSTGNKDKNKNRRRSDDNDPSSERKAKDERGGSLNIKV